MLLSRFIRQVREAQAIRVAWGKDMSTLVGNLRDAYLVKAGAGMSEEEFAQLEADTDAMLEREYPVAV